MKAVLFDMDGTLVDSEKLWDVAMHKLYTKLGGVLTPEVRESTVGGSSENVIRIVYTDLGLEHDPVEMAATADWLHEIAGELFDAGLPWCDGARELLEALSVAAVPMALVTNTRRGLTERALNGIGRHYFTASVCGDEVPRGKPAPDPTAGRPNYSGWIRPTALGHRGLGHWRGLGAGCRMSGAGGANDIAVPIGPRRRQISSLADVDHETLVQIYHRASAGDDR